MSDSMFTKTLLNNSNNYSNIIESLPTRQLILFYIKSICVGFWIVIKWLIFFIWTKLTASTSNAWNQQSNSNNSKSIGHYQSTNSDNYYPNKPPEILVDNKLGRHSYVKLKGVKFHYTEIGNVENPLIILLHGFPDCWLGWYRQIHDLAKFFRVISIDLKGFNDSDKPSLINYYKPEIICEELKQFIFSLGTNSATIIGHDLGALIGWYFAHTNPEHIERFICVGTPHPNLIWNNLNTKCVMNQTWLKFIQLPFLPELDHSSMYSNFLEKCLATIFQDEKKYHHRSTFYKKTSYSDIINKGYLSSNINQKNELSFEETYTKENLKDSYKYIFSRRSDWIGPLNYYRQFPFYRIKDNLTIRCPVLLITGNEDDYYRLESIIKSTDYCDNSIVKVIEDCGHWPHRQAAAEFNKILLNFLVGKRAQEKLANEIDGGKLNGNDSGKLLTKNLVGRMLGAVTSSSVKFGSSVIDSVHQKTNTVLNSALY